MKITAYLQTALIACVSFTFAHAGETTPLFNGKNLDGWKVLPGGTWTVEDGVIVGRSPKSEKRHGILLSEKEYTDFVVTAKFRVLSGDSGFYFRSDPVNRPASVNGIQVEVDSSQETGGLYETGGRYWISKVEELPADKQFYTPGEWSTLELRAEGGDIEVKINGVVSAKVTNDIGRKKGHFGLQLHGGDEMHVEFKDINIEELDTEPEFVDMFNGKDLTGWKTTGNWLVKEGNVVALEPRPGEKGWTRYGDYLTTYRPYGDFELDLEFKFAPRGNSGVFMRVGDLKDHVTSGFEVQILDTHGKEKFGHHDCGGVIRTSAPKKMVVKPAGEWNRYQITLKGSHLKVVLNGELIQDLDLSESEMKDRPLKGYISFQDEGKQVWYRNVRIKEL